MTIEQIKAAVDAGKTVHWANASYTVIRDSLGQYLIRRGDRCCGLTDRSGTELQGREDQFFIA